MGLTTGTRINFPVHIKNLRFFGQLDGSVTEVRFITTNSHFQESDLQTKLIWACSLSPGVDYQIYNRFHVSTGCSLGFTSGHYNVFNEVMLSPFLGIDYRFGTLKKK
ncbi:MAG: hypothetical protein V1775_12230 [Bacteroidota bacterium]